MKITTIFDCIRYNRLNKTIHNLERCQPLRFAHNVKVEKNINDFMNDLLLYATKKKTYYAYSNERQCREYCHRSLGDLYLITRYYFPDTTFIQFYKLFQNQIWGTHFCNTINKRVFFREHRNYQHEEIKDEFGLTKLDWNKWITEIADKH